MQDWTTVKMDKEIHERAKAYCKENGMTISGLVKKLLSQYLRTEAERTEVKTSNGAV
jgi:antitoxin component of RelBE/YafQ-DinJ toxin-antitoxin module